MISVGDVAHLPSVSPGQGLADLIESEICVLTKLKRARYLRTTVACRFNPLETQESAVTKPYNYGGAFFRAANTGALAS